MAKIRLSPTQISVLLDLNREGNCLQYMGGMNPYWFFSHNLDRVRQSTVSALLKLGMITRGSGSPARITEQGKQYLAGRTGGEEIAAETTPEM